MENKVKQNTRQCNIELLRGVLMFMVVVLHIISYNAFSLDHPISVTSDNFIPASILESFCIIAVDCYVIISGYFGIKVSVEKYFKLILPIVFYALSISIINSIVYHDFNKTNLLCEFFPATTHRYWFVPVYLTLFLASPFLNSVIKKADKTAYQKLLFVGTLLFVIVPTISGYGIITDKGYGIVNFALLYLYGGYISRFYNVNKDKKELIKWVSIYFFFSCLTSILNIFSTYRSGIVGWQSHWYNYNDMFVNISAVSFFMIFLNIRFSKKWILKLSPSFFYIYIIHEHHRVNLPLHRLPILKDAPYFESYNFILVIIMASCIVFFGCLAVDLLRRAIFGRAFDKSAKICSRIFERVMYSTLRGIKKTPIKQYFKGIVND